ncbi:MAG TPA: protein translocase subunit SecD [Candidatus Binatia bacterium]|nr:protein translocase subunit SecD [Candidatus Binatia bacterium]
MNQSNLWMRMGLVAALVVTAATFLVPTYAGGRPDGWPAFLPGPIRLGLDLQGGTHLVYTVDIDKAIANHVDRAAEELRNEARTEQIGLANVAVQGGMIVAQLSDASKRGALEKLISDRFPNLSIDPDSAGENIVRAKMTPGTIREIREGALDQSLEIMRNRVDQFGVAEPIVQREGDRDILVQLPGIQDPEHAKALIGKTALLEFKLVAKDPSAPGLITMPLREVDRATGRVSRSDIKVEPRTLMTGEVLTNARPRPGTVTEGPHVEFELNARGAKIFEEITGNNVGRQLAIILDGVVQSAPRINDRISNRGVITGSFDLKEARDLALVLRTGALPAPVNPAEERTVGPSLGKDSIRQGVISFVVGGSLVVVFMLVYYKLAGLLADSALVLNVLFSLAALAAFGATLTLPGIAGIVLTLGMAVDANVLINERIREELRLGKTARAAIDAGYERALPAILDSNTTTFLSGIILFQFGSGPVKGFAVTLCIGIATSLFTAVVGTRVVYDYLLSRRRLQTVSV